MKIKKINIVELHIEKLIALLILGGAAWIMSVFVFGGPYNITRSGKVLRPPEVDNELVMKAKEVDKKISDKADSPLPDLTIPDYSQLIEDRMEMPLIESDEYYSPMSWPGVREIKPPIIIEGTGEVPEPPALENVSLSFGHYLLVSDDYDQYLELTAPPRDIWATSISAQFPTSKWQEKLEKFIQEVGGIDLLGKVKIFVNVKIERQIKVDDAFGAYVGGTFEEGAFEVIKPLPGRPDNTQYMSKEKWDQEDGKAFLAKLRNPGEQELILNPEFPLLDGESPKWKAPEAYTLRQKSETGTATPVVATPAAVESPDTTILESGQVVLKPTFMIAHDITMKPGETYRFRLVLSVLNPAFQEQNIVNISDQTKQKLAVESTKRAPWSEEVRVPDQQFVLVSKTTSEKAFAEIWHLFGGKWIPTEYEIEPGQMIGGTQEVSSDRYTKVLEQLTDYLLVDLIPLPGGGIRGPEYKAVLMNKKTGEIEIRSPRQERKTTLRKMLDSSDFQAIIEYQNKS